MNASPDHVRDSVLRHVESIGVRGDLAGAAIAREQRNHRRRVVAGAVAAISALAIAVPVGWDALGQQTPPQLPATASPTAPTDATSSAPTTSSPQQPTALGTWRPSTPGTLSPSAPTTPSTPPPSAPTTPSTPSAPSAPVPSTPVPSAPPSPSVPTPTTPGPSAPTTPSTPGIANDPVPGAYASDVTLHIAGRTIALAGVDRVARLWALSGGGAVVDAMSGIEGSTRVLDADGNSLATLPQGWIAVSPDRTRIATSGSDGGQVFDTSGSLVAKRPGSFGRVAVAGSFVYPPQATQRRSGTSRPMSPAPCPAVSPTSPPTAPRRCGCVGRHFERGAGADVLGGARPDNGHGVRDHAHVSTGRHDHRAQLVLARR